MEIKFEKTGAEALVTLNGRLDTVTSPELEAIIANELDGITDLTLDFKGVDYISSAGLRVLLRAQKKMNMCGQMNLINANPMIMEIFEITGFNEILTIE